MNEVKVFQSNLSSNFIDYEHKKNHQLILLRLGMHIFLEQNLIAEIFNKLTEKGSIYCSIDYHLKDHLMILQKT